MGEYLFRVEHGPPEWRGPLARRERQGKLNPTGQKALDLIRSYRDHREPGDVFYMVRGLFRIYSPLEQPWPSHDAPRLVREAVTDWIVNTDSNISDRELESIIAKGEEANAAERERFQQSKMREDRNRERERQTRAGEARAKSNKEVAHYVMRCRGKRITARRIGQIVGGEATRDKQLAALIARGRDLGEPASKFLKRGDRAGFKLGGYKTLMRLRAWGTLFTDFLEHADYTSPLMESVRELFHDGLVGDLVDARDLDLLAIKHGLPRDGVFPMWRAFERWHGRELLDREDAEDEEEEAASLAPADGEGN